MTHGSRAPAVFSIAAGILFCVDVVLKMIARRFLMEPRVFVFTPAGPIGFIPSVNDVLAFSLPIPNVWIWPVGGVVVLALIGMLGRISDFKFQIRDRRALAITAIVLGAMSNLTDRTFLGGVTDYLSLTNAFPAFNIADLLILGGVIVWAISERRREYAIA